MRPSKDAYYLTIARAVATRSTCLDRQYGAVVVKGNKILSTGYNGSTWCTDNCCDINDCAAERYGDKLRCRAVHAEANAILQAGVENCCGAVLYLYCDTKDEPRPCDNCRKLIEVAKIHHVTNAAGSFRYFFDDKVEEEWRASRKKE
jgi:dCMP deaminase